MKTFVATYSTQSGLFRILIGSIDRSEAYRLAIQRTPKGMCLTHLRERKG